jgi:flagellar basal-body rod modification protein FlgD
MDTTPVGNTTNNSSSTVSNKQDLGKADFLKLLVAQLRYQDPMKPMEDKEFIAQMAQFNALEEMRNLNKSFAAMSDFNQLSQASSMLGKLVAIRTDDEHFAGTVEEVRRVEGEIMVMVAGKAYPLSAIQQVANPQADAPPVDDKEGAPADDKQQEG